MTPINLTRRPALSKWLLALAALASLAFCTQASADDSPIEDDGVPDPSIATSLPPEFGGLFGVRQALAKRGIQFGVNYIADGFGNTSGGLKRGVTYMGRGELVVDADFDTLVGLRGLTFHGNAFQIHGRGITRYNIGALEPTSNIEATPATRLSEAWFEQDLFADKVNVRLGQFGADAEFLTSSNAGLFINGTFGWPAITAVNLPNGGPAYPLTTPGARVKVTVTPELSLLAAVFNGDPAGPRKPFGSADPQVRNNDGIRFRLRDPPFAISEGQYAFRIGGLPGALNIGGWHHFGRFSDQRFSTDFLPLASPASNGLAQPRRGDSGVYGVFDQQLYAVPGSTDGDGIGAFVRVSVSPNDRNAVSAYIDGGLNFTGVVPGRPNDSFGIAGSHVRLSSRLRAFDRDVAALTGQPTPIRSAESSIEATYLYNVVDGFGVQPTVQYVIRPAGGVVDPGDPAGLRRIHNAAIVGLRTQIRY